MGDLFRLLTLGLIGGIGFTVVTHADGVKAFFQGIDSLYLTAARTTTGQLTPGT